MNSDVLNGGDEAFAGVSPAAPLSASASPSDPLQERDLGLLPSHSSSVASGLVTSAAALHPPHPPVSQPLPLPPTVGVSAPAPAPPMVSTGSVEGMSLMGMGMGSGPGGGMQNGTGTLGPNRSKTSFLAKKRLAQGPNGATSPTGPFYTGMAGGPPSSLSVPAPPPQAAGGPPPSPQGPPNFPALHLHPLNDTFVPKQISLAPMGTRVKVGRQTNAKTVPNSSNGFFDSKVLSRMHAEVWSEDGRVWLKDVKSSNGTFINGERLSPEGVESEAFELHTDDVVEFGIDIVSDDNKTIVHHKVAAKVFLVLTAEDAAACSREFASYYRAVGDSGLHRRPSRAGAFAGGSFDHVMNRLQSELEKSRATGSELGGLNATINEITDTLGGGGGPPPPLPPPYQPSRSGVLPGHSPGNGRSTVGPDPHAQTLAAVQSQLADTQASLASHTEKIQTLEGLLAEYEVIKREVTSLRGQIEEASASRASRGLRGDEDARERGRAGGGRVSPVAAMLEAQDDEEVDDGASVASVDTVTLDSDLKASPAKPLPNGVHRVDMDSPVSTPPPAPQPQLPPLSPPPPPSAAFALAEDHARLVEQNVTLTTRLESLSAELNEATKLGQVLRTQHTEASETIRALEARVQGLEREVEGRVAAAAEGQVRRWEGWRKAFEEGWKKEQEDWKQEREKLLATIKDWEMASTSSGSASEREGAGAPRPKKERPPDGPAKRSRSIRRKRRASTAAAAGKPKGNKRLDRVTAVEGEVGSDSDASTAVVGSRSMDDLAAARATAVAEGKLAGRANGGRGGPRTILDTSHLPYLSAAGVVLVGIAAFSLVQKVKD